MLGNRISARQYVYIAILASTIALAVWYAKDVTMKPSVKDGD